MPPTRLIISGRTVVLLKTVAIAAMGIAALPLQGTAEIFVLIVMASIFESMTNDRPGARTYCLACILLATSESVGMTIFSMMAASVAAYGIYDDISQAISDAENRRKNDPGGNPPGQP